MPHDRYKQSVVAVRQRFTYFEGKSWGLTDTLTSKGGREVQFYVEKITLSKGRCWQIQEMEIKYVSRVEKEQ